MAAIWSEPESPFFQRIPGFAAGQPFRGRLPDYGQEKPKPIGGQLNTTDFSQIPFPVIGTDFSSGQRDQDLQWSTGSAIPALDQNLQSYLDFYRAASPTRMAEQQQAYELAAGLTEKQLASLYPYLSAAAAESTARNLAASKAYRKFSEQLPSSVQSITASKQQQMLAAAQGEAERQRATAAQQAAAKEFAGKFAGQYINVG